MTSVRQFPLKLAQPTSFELGDFIVSESNRDAFAFVGDWGTAAGNFAALVGPKGAGKSHLLRGWAQDAGAQELGPKSEIAALKAQALYFIDDVDAVEGDGAPAFSDDFLFHLFNWSREVGAKVMVTAQLAPSAWARKLPDLKSRLGTVPVAAISEPDDDLLFAVIIKLFSDKQLQVDLDVIHFMVSRMERSFEATQKLVTLIDERALALKRRITKSLVRDCMGEAG